MEDLLAKYTSADKTRVAKDWLNVLPPMKKDRPLSFFNRVGPLAAMVYLKTSTFPLTYTAQYSVHNLCYEFRFIMATLLRVGGPIKLAEHEMKYEQAAERLCERAYIPIGGDLTIDDIIMCYERFFADKRASHPLAEYRDIVLVCGWTKRADKIEYALKVAYDEMKTWEEKYFPKEGFQSWFKELEERAWDGDKLNEVFESELVKHKLEKMPVRKLVF